MLKQKQRKTTVPHMMFMAERLALDSEVLYVHTPQNMLHDLSRKCPKHLTENIPWWPVAAVQTIHGVADGSICLSRLQYLHSASLTKSGTFRISTEELDSRPVMNVPYYSPENVTFVRFKERQTYTKVLLARFFFFS